METLSGIYLDYGPFVHLTSFYEVRSKKYAFHKLEDMKCKDVLAYWYPAIFFFF